MVVRGHSIVGATLFPVSDGTYVSGAEENYFLPGSGAAFEAGDPNAVFGVSGPQGGWGHFKNQTGSTLGYSYQCRRDHSGRDVRGSFNPRLARLQDRITKADSGIRSKYKYVEIAASLREFFPDQLLARAMQLFEQVLPRLTGNVENDYGCVLACIEFWLLDNGTMVKSSVIDEINSHLGLSLTRSHMDRHKMAIKRACVKLYGRKETFERFHHRGPVVIEKHVNEILVSLDLDRESKLAIKHVVHRVIDRLLMSKFVPKHYEAHALALIKIAGEELNLWSSDWNCYLQLDDRLKKSVYMIAYKYGRTVDDWSFALPVEEQVDVLTVEEVKAINTSEMTIEVLSREEMLQEQVPLENEAENAVDNYETACHFPLAAAGSCWTTLEDLSRSSVNELRGMKLFALNLLLWEMKGITGQEIGDDDSISFAGQELGTTRKTEVIHLKKLVLYDLFDFDLWLTRNGVSSVSGNSFKLLMNVFRLPYHSITAGG
ncbi:MAG: hypothetical protein ACFFD4_03950 [Candidatus Odinarchaeota archaeon]